MMPPDDEKPKLDDTIFNLSQMMVRLDPGPLARLRRMNPEGPGETDFWKLAVDSGLRTDTLGLTLVRLMALLAPKGDPRNPKKLHDGKRSLGAALAETIYPETRLMHFIAMPFAERSEALERMVRWLAQKGHNGVNCTDIAALMFIDDEKPARKLAETYYRALAHMNKTGKEENAA